MLPSSGKICSFVWTRVLIQLCFFCGLYFDYIQIQSFSGHFNFLHLSTLPRSDFPGSQGAKKHHRLVLFRWAGAKFLVFYVFFFLWRMQTLQRTRNVWRLNWQISQGCTFAHYAFFVLNVPLFTLSTFSLYRSFFRYLFVLRYFERTRQHTRQGRK